jgi:hypothetical protein
MSSADNTGTLSTLFSFNLSSSHCSTVFVEDDLRVSEDGDDILLGFGAVSIFRTEDFSLEDGTSVFLRNVGIYRRVYKAPKLRTRPSSSPP